MREHARRVLAQSLGIQLGRCICAAFLSLLLIAAATVVSSSSPPAETRDAVKAMSVANGRQFLVFGYLPEYRQTADFPYEDVFRHGLTHLIFFSVEINPRTLELVHTEDRLPQGASWRRIRALADVYNVKLMVTVGGGGRSAGFSALVRSPARRRSFAEQLNRFVLAKQLDGVDFNWEYPGSHAEWRDFGRFLLEVRSLLGYTSVTERAASSAGQQQPGATVHTRTVHARPVLLSLAVHPQWGIAATLMAHRIPSFVDYIHWMSYDYVMPGQPHSSVDYAKTSLSEFLIDPLQEDISITADARPRYDGRRRSHLGVHAARGDYRSKLTLGVPLYGRHLVNTRRRPETYARLVYFLRQWALKYHPEWSADGAELRKTNNYSGYAFTSYDDMQAKMRLACTAGPPGGIAGIMLWELGQDLLPPSQQGLSLMAAVSEELRRWNSSQRPEGEPLPVTPPEKDGPHVHVGDRAPREAAAADDGLDDL